MEQCFRTAILFSYGKHGIRVGQRPTFILQKNYFTHSAPIGLYQNSNSNSLSNATKIVWENVLQFGMLGKPHPHPPEVGYGGLMIMVTGARRTGGENAKEEYDHRALRSQKCRTEYLFQNKFPKDTSQPCNLYDHPIPFFLQETLP